MEDITKDFLAVVKILKNPNNKPQHAEALKKIVNNFEIKWGSTSDCIFTCGLVDILDKQLNTL